jgi:myosin heavy subunit
MIDVSLHTSHPMRLYAYYRKTEATKQCLDYLTKVSTASNGDSSVKECGDKGDDAISDIAHRIIAASPILEAFGNAQTVRNPNSSRFGKWMELTFDQHNEIKGSRIISYLLEVLFIHNSIDNIHVIFYFIISSN